MAFSDAYQWLLDGENRPDIIEAIIEKHPKSNFKAVILHAMAAIGSNTKEPKSFVTGWCIESLRGLYNKMLAAGDYGGALSAIKEIHKINNSHDEHDTVEDFLNRE